MSVAGILAPRYTSAARAALAAIQGPMTPRQVLWRPSETESYRILQAVNCGMDFVHWKQPVSAFQTTSYTCEIEVSQSFDFVFFK